MDMITLPTEVRNTGKNMGCFMLTLSGADYYLRAQVINDATTDVQAKVMNSAPLGTEGAVVTRNIPSDDNVKELLLAILTTLEEIRDTAHALAV